jgi:hypothetical protein
VSFIRRATVASTRTGRCSAFGFSRCGRLRAPPSASAVGDPPLCGSDDAARRAGPPGIARTEHSPRRGWAGIPAVAGSSGLTDQSAPAAADPTGTGTGTGTGGINERGLLTASNKHRPPGKGTSLLGSKGLFCKCRAKHA